MQRAVQGRPLGARRASRRPAPRPLALQCDVSFQCACPQRRRRRCKGARAVSGEGGAARRGIALWPSCTSERSCASSSPSSSTCCRADRAEAARWVRPWEAGRPHRRGAHRVHILRNVVVCDSDVRELVGRSRPRCGDQSAALLHGRPILPRATRAHRRPREDGGRPRLAAGALRQLGSNAADHPLRLCHVLPQNALQRGLALSGGLGHLPELGV